jgi:CRP-like cAMP-binding protein
VLYIEDGRVRLSVVDRSGKEAVVGLLGAGAFLGEEALGGLAARRETAIALTPVRVLVVEKGQMLRLLRTEHRVTDRFVAHVLARHAAIEANLIDQLLGSSEQRVARCLLGLAGCDDRGRCASALPNVSQSIIAEMVGTTRSRVNRFIARFRKLGLVERRGGTLVVTPALLDVAAGDDSRVAASSARRTAA